MKAARVSRLVLVSGLLVLASCAGNGASSSDSTAVVPHASVTTGASTGPSSVAPGAEIVIGSVGLEAGPNSGTTGEDVDAVKVWVKMINDKGGIKGHPVRYITKDTGGDPARHKQAVQELVEQDHVVAFVQNLETLDGQPSVDYIVQKKMVVIGGEGYEDWYYNNPGYFPQMDASSVQFSSAALAGTASATVSEGKTKYALFYCLYAQCEAAATSWKNIAPQVGVDVVYSAKLDTTLPDFTAACLAAKQAGAQVIELLTSQTAATTIAQNCARQNYRPVFGFNSGVGGSSLLSVPELNGAIVTAAVGFPGVTQSNGMAEMMAAFAKYSPGTVLSNNDVAGWASAKLFEKAATMATDPTSTASLMDALYSIKNDDLGGITSPRTFVRGQNVDQSQTCFAVAKQSDGKFVAVGDGQIHCQPIK